MKKERYKIDFLQFTATGSVRSDCSDITFYNNGANPVTINSSVTLYTGQSLSINANNDELDTTIYNFTFPPSALTSILIVIRKNYIN